MAAKTTTAPEQERVTVFIPRLPHDDDKKLVMINGKAYPIPRGVPYKVPKFVAEVLEHEQFMQNKAYEYKQALKKQAASKELAG